MTVMEALVLASKSRQKYPMLVVIFVNFTYRKNQHVRFFFCDKLNNGCILNHLHYFRDWIFVIGSRKIISWFSYCIPYESCF